MLLNLVANVINPDLLPRDIFLIINALVAAGLLGFGVLYVLRYIELLKRWRGYAETFFFPKAKRLAKRRVEFLDQAISRFEEELTL